MERTIKDGDINYEHKILGAIFHDRESWEKLSGTLDTSEFSERGKLVYEGISEFYQRDGEATCCARQEVIDRIAHKVRRPKHQELFVNIIDSISALDVSPGNVTANFLALARINAGNALAGALTSGYGNEADIRALLERYEDILEKELDEGEKDGEDEVCGLDVQELFEKSYDGELIKVMPETLNERLGGGVLRGHHIVVYARPEVGKTLITLNMVAGFIEQGLKVLYIGNEEPNLDLSGRLASRLCGMSRNQITENYEEARKRLADTNYGNVVFKTLAPGTPLEILSATRKHNPDVLVVDQIRNLTVNEDSKVLQLERAAQFVRVVGQRHNLLSISLTQAGDSADGKAVLGQGDVDFSNTGIPGACDVMVAIGASEEDDRIGRRVISLPKNKPGGGLHESFPVYINTHTGEVRSKV
jgi:KaiC/GvpD/RAD55 family RecA-like ATPase